MSGTFRCPIKPQAANNFEVVPASIVQRLDFAGIFGREAPVEIDVGCGDGTFVTTLAAGNPDRNYLGIERLLGRVRSVCYKANRCRLSNLRVLRMDASYALAHLIAPESVSTLHLLFPDPWPKRRHHRRRTITAEFVSAVHRALEPAGLLHIATDHAEYFAGIHQLVMGNGSFVERNEPAVFPRSRFEKKFAAEGAEIHRLLMRKTSPVR